ncbi:uncharacterized protein BDR25DRAFT_251030 [Lindgomyces ingoldianus]|uniref:Uncharacterized protein n=1 Tax=Lindgomyces ingoldianus TaxID=673940 RepID=A0ACB6RIX4_9PLEO|nr:uncharacterized protein BDR25DRAFT_251030 [Lindgomyces ingoldianus]KAF2478295.1 hypothetical protein BDR25DRAFT_251030 [Lindgomyces ingoldianus]
MADASKTTGPQPAKPKRLVLCFDGTGNKFLGNEADTNIVKLYQLLDRRNPDQYHYYQPGIGTYIENDTSNASSGGGLWHRIKASVYSSIDQGIATSFVDHVVAGYRFLMRYYSEGDQIYIFGFSRGAYTARFLAEMVYKIGLLSRGNEEMVKFAWNTFSDYQRTKGNVPQTREDIARVEFMRKFRQTFCHVNAEGKPVNVYFLGLFDCVNSVGTFELPMHQKSYEVIASPPARWIRHAISIHERRLKFKPALFNIDDDAAKTYECDVKEVWFSGNHGDVGGGWGLADDQKKLLSDIPLQWMLQELDQLPDEGKLAWKKPRILSSTPEPPEKRGWFASIFFKGPLSPHEARLKTSKPHDVLAFGGGISRFGTIGWWVLEVLPFFSRLELEDGKWVPRHFPPNLGASRDIPSKAIIHPSVEAMYRAGVLTTDQMPVLGGTESETQKLFRVKAFTSTWDTLRKTRAKEAKDQNLEQLEAKCWDNVGNVAARNWSLA